MNKVRFFCKLIFGAAVAVIYLWSISKADFSGFVDKLNTMNVPVERILAETGVTRYELTRLLNAVECKDCINPDQNYTDRYTNDFWNTFVDIPGKDFGDIKYKGAKFANKSYYYCVAYAGDNDYMRGYPIKTSPICAGQFCGDRPTTKAEFIQVIINVLSKYIFSMYAINRQQARDRVVNLDTESYEGKNFTADDIKTFKARAKDCGDQSCVLKSSAELKLYLKYCMFNLEKCGMMPFGKIKEGFWPVAELNLLYRQNMLNVDEAAKYDIGKMIDGKLMLQIFGGMNDLIGCAFNNDYDCDGILNNNDSCPYTYNPKQKDTDHDGIGDVCDDDIDGDGVKNPIGIVDDNGNINISLRIGSMDNCLFAVNTDQAHTRGWMGDVCINGSVNIALTIAVQSVKGTLPQTIQFAALSKGNVQSLSWDFGDGNMGSGQTVTHTYNNPGLYTVNLVAKGNGSNDAYARTTVIVGKNPNDKLALGILANNISITTGKDVSISLSLIGKYDQYERNFGDGTIASSKQDSIKKIYRQGGTYPVSIKAYSNGNLASAGMFWVGIGPNTYGSLLKASVLNPDVFSPVIFKTEVYGFGLRDIESISWNFGDGTLIETNTFDTSHIYKKSGKKAVLQTITFNNGKKLTNLITIYVVAPNLFDSYSIQLIPSNLVSNTFSRLTFATDIIGSSIDKLLFFGNNYDDGKSDIIPVTNKIRFPYNKYHIYNTPGIYYPQTSLNIDQCTWLSAQATISVQGNDFCLEAKLNGDLNKYKCDMDKDGIPDICDTDLDGDGIPNLLGIINPENYNSCDYIGAIKNGNKDNLLNLSILNKQFIGVCSLDNAPFTANPDQADTNRNNLGDTQDNILSGVNTQEILPEKDTDGDGIPDYMDQCPLIPENYNGIRDYDGCPEIGAELGCENNNFTGFPGGAGGRGIGGGSGGTSYCGDKLTNGTETCLSCPADIGSCTSTGGYCGDKLTNGTETCLSCPVDVGVCTDTCGNTFTDPGETCLSCPQDAGECTDTCGNNIQEPTENCLTCPIDSKNCLLIIPQTCNQCPCPFSDYSSALTNNDQVKAVLWDAQKKYPRGYSIAFPIIY